MLKQICFLAGMAFFTGGGATAIAQTAPMPIKVVVVTTFEAGADTGDVPGEFQNWVEREHLGETLEFPGGVHSLRINKTHDVLGVVTGMTLANAGPSIMALGLDRRFDLTKAYWLVNGIAGVDPADGTIGTAAWANYVVNDVARQIDAKEMPPSWPYGLFVIGAKEPNAMPAHPMTDDAYPLNRGLTAWAYGLTKGLSLPDNAAMSAERKRWAGFPKAMAPPTVIVGDSFASDQYWHGAVLTQYANDWVKLWTGGKGNFAMANMEDSAITEALRRLDAMHRVEYRRVMVLRVGSNFSMETPGSTALASVTAPYVKSTALECAWMTGSAVVRELVRGWANYGTTVPAGAGAAGAGAP